MDDEGKREDCCGGRYRWPSMYELYSTNCTTLLQSSMTRRWDGGEEPCCSSFFILKSSRTLVRSRDKAKYM